MSVALLSAHEYATTILGFSNESALRFAIEKKGIAEAVEMCLSDELDQAAAIATCNVRTWNDRYREKDVAVTREEISTCLQSFLVRLITSEHARARETALTTIGQYSYNCELRGDHDATFAILAWQSKALHMYRALADRGQR